MIHAFSRPRAGNRTVLRTVALAAGLLAAGCSVLRAAPDRSRYFVISSTETSPIASHGRSDIHFGLGPVKLPGYLDTQNIVRMGGGGSIEYVPDAFWAESVKDSFSRALLYRTGARIGTGHAVAYPWYSTTRVDFKVPVDVLRFEATSDGRAVLDARWSVEVASSGAVIAGTESVFEETAGSDPASIVEALNRCVDRLADAIATAVANAAPASSASSSETLRRRQ